MIKNALFFIRQYLSKPRTVGAVLPSSKYLAKKMVQGIDFNNADCIVEYGAGTGVFTDEILAERRADTLVILIEKDIKFYKLLNEKYKGISNINIVNDSAEHIGKYLMKYGVPYADYVVSGLPFASLPRDISENILTQTKKHLKHDGEFITFQYTLLKKLFIGQFFDKIDIRREVRNFPPAYVFSYK